MGQKIYALYEHYCRTYSDIFEHLPTLKRYGDDSESLIEFGVRYGVSSTAFLASNAKQIISYDINYNDSIKNLQNICNEEGRMWDFRLGNSMFVEIQSADTIFVDTFHSFDVLRLEISRFYKFVKKYFIFHDVVSFGRSSEGGGDKGLMDAIEEFLLNHSDEFKIKEMFTNNNGLMVLERINK